MRADIVKEYIEMRNNKGYNLNVFWKMYKSEGGTLTNPQDFMNHFLYDIQVHEGVEVRMTRDINNILLGIDSKLNLTSLFDADGQFIKIVN